MIPHQFLAVHIVDHGEGNRPKTTAFDDSHSGYHRDMYAGYVGKRELCHWCMVSFLLIPVFDKSSNNTSAAVSLPSIGRELDIEQSQLEWLVRVQNI